ncbi:MAG: hypothetical protein ACQEVA_01185 [Myxococcota bacterium]
MRTSATQNLWLVLGFLILVFGTSSSAFGDPDGAQDAEGSVAQTASEDERDGGAGRVANNPKAGRVDIGLGAVSEGRVAVSLRLPNDSQARDPLAKACEGQKKKSKSPVVLLERADWPDSVSGYNSLDVLSPEGVKHLEFTRIFCLPASGERVDFGYRLETEESEALDGGKHWVTLVAPAGQMSPKAEFEWTDGKAPPKEVVSKLWEAFVARFDGEQRSSLEYVAAEEDDLGQYMKAVRSSFGESFVYAVNVNVCNENSNKTFYGCFSANYLLDETAETIVELEPPHWDSSPIWHMAVADPDGDGRSGLYYVDTKPPLSPTSIKLSSRRAFSRWVEVVDGEVSVHNLKGFRFPQ